MILCISKCAFTNYWYDSFMFGSAVKGNDLCFLWLYNWKICADNHTLEYSANLGSMYCYLATETFLSAITITQTIFYHPKLSNADMQKNSIAKIVTTTVLSISMTCRQVVFTLDPSQLPQMLCTFWCKCETLLPNWFILSYSVIYLLCF